jgi:hypothetical protein
LWTNEGKVLGFPDIVVIHSNKDDPKIGSMRELHQRRAISHAEEVTQEIRELFKKNYVKPTEGPAKTKEKSHLCFERDSHRVHTARNILFQTKLVELFVSKLGFILTCQSKPIERSPRPSFPLVPPNTRETAALLGAARQIIEKPVRSGKIHSGKSSQTKILSQLAIRSRAASNERLTWRRRCKRL